MKLNWFIFVVSCCASNKPVWSLGEKFAKKLFFLLIASLAITISVTEVYAQDQHFVDSLQTQLKNHNDSRLKLGKNTPALYDTTAVNILYELSKANWYADLDKAMDYAKESLVLSGQINYKKGAGFAYYSMGVIKVRERDFLVAMELTKKGLKTGEEIGDKKLIASSYLNIGVVYNQQYNFSEALKNFQIALKKAEEISDKQIMAWAYGNTGEVYGALDNYTEALKNHFAGLKINQEMGDKTGIAAAYCIIGQYYADMGKYSEALKYQFIALKKREEMEDGSGIADSYYSIGYACHQQGSYPEALKYYFLCLRIFKEFANSSFIGATYGLIGLTYTKQKKYNEAFQYLNKSLKISKESGDLISLKFAYQTLAELDSARAASPLNSLKKRGEYAIKSLEFYKLFIIIRDSLSNKENTRKITRLEMQYDFDKKEAATRAEQVTKDILANVEIKRHKMIRNFSFSGIACILLFSGYGFQRYRSRKKKESQQALLSERLRISSELHDEVGATLSGIAMYSHLTKEQMKTGQTAEIEKSLNIMQQSSTEMVDKLSDIVWLINPEQDSLQKLVTRLEEYAADMAAIKNIHVKISVPEKIAEINLPVESRRNIYLFCKEAINNAIKYSNATLLELTVKEVNGKLEFSVSDNGRGFDAVMVRRGNGLENMQKRADEIGAKLTVQSKENEGASVSLQCKIG